MNELKEIVLRKGKEDSLKFSPVGLFGSHCAQTDAIEEGEVVHVLAADSSFWSWPLSNWEYCCAYPLISE